MSEKEKEKICTIHVACSQPRKPFWERLKHLETQVEEPSTFTIVVFKMPPSSDYSWTTEVKDVEPVGLTVSTMTIMHGKEFYGKQPKG